MEKPFGATWGFYDCSKINERTSFDEQAMVLYASLGYRGIPYQLFEQEVKKLTDPRFDTDIHLGKFSKDFVREFGKTKAPKGAPRNSFLSMLEL
jgi:hypothetical protein